MAQEGTMRVGTAGTVGTECEINTLGADGTGNLPGNRELVVPIRPLDEPAHEMTEAVVNRPSFALHEDWFMLDSRTYAPGVYWHGGDRSGKPVDIWVSTPIRMVASTADETSHSFGRLLEFIDTDGRWREWAMPMTLLSGSGEELRRGLLDMGVRIATGQGQRLIAYLMQPPPRRRITAAIRPGWHRVGDELAFVLPDEVIGSDNIRFQSETAGPGQFGKSGTLEEWRQSISILCRGNPVLIFAVSVALAAPLLKLARQQEAGGAGFNLMGDSSRGKTTALQLAASVFGAPHSVRTWRATANGLEAAATEANDMLMVLDEISQCDPREIGAVVYAMANGAGKQRANQKGGARATARYRNMLLSSGERTLAGHLAEAKLRPKAGQEARLFDVPATGRPHGVFDSLHGHQDGRAFADALKSATGVNYGTAGREFVRRLIEDRRDLPTEYARFKELPNFQCEDALEARAASYFALVALAGELATEMGITGWESGDAMEAAVWALEAWRSQRGAGLTEDRQILNGVRDFILKHGDTRFGPFPQDAGGPVRDRAGYWRDKTMPGAETARVYYFHEPALCEAASFGISRIVQALDHAGWIEEQDSDRFQKTVKVHGKNTRFYAILIPDEEDMP